MSGSTFKRLENLAERIINGGVVFFIGAGFSIDSENNTAWRLIIRLVIRFSALINTLGRIEQKNPTSKKISDKLRQALNANFGLMDENGLLSKSNIEKLARDYYQINEWMCNAYCMILERIFEEDIGGSYSEIEKELETKEIELLNTIKYDKEKITLGKFRLLDYTKLKFNLCGKALFLDTMGFDDADIMGGEPFKDDISDVLSSYRHRLFKRHHVLAKLAREGLSSPLITTNYDLLLEGAYRLAGFKHLDNNPGIKEQAAPVLYPYFKVIGDANHFFHFGSGHRTALIAKIHGCVNQYRKHKEKQCSESNNKGNSDCNDYWEKYLPSMVFTYREIQNWREDEWSRDYIQTLQRTHTIVFCGYSISDPVLHDTFRSVYEEMEKKRLKSVPIEEDEAAINPPAFFFGTSGKREFHGLEILRAASKSVNVGKRDLYEKSSDITDHENYLPFHLHKVGLFPNVDELMIWIFHLTCRRIQSQCIENNLSQLMGHMLGHPCPKRELIAFRNCFKELIIEEKKTAAGWDDTIKSRHTFSKITGWTEYFHTNLLKQYAAAEDYSSSVGLHNKTGDKFSSHWYYPFSGNPEWTAWGVVLEVALRKITRKLQNSDKKWTDNTDCIEIIPDTLPSAAVSLTGKYKTPILLELKFHDSDVSSFPGMKNGIFRKRLTWFLNPEDLPWEKEKEKKEPGDEIGIKTPDALLIWNWAIGKFSDGPIEGKMKASRGNVTLYFGEYDE